MKNTAQKQKGIKNVDARIAERDFLREHLTTDEKRTISNDTGYSLDYINKILSGDRTIVKGVIAQGKKILFDRQQEMQKTLTEFSNN